MFVLTTVNGQVNYDVQYATITEAATEAARLTQVGGLYMYPIKYTKPKKPKVQVESFTELKARARATMSDDTIRTFGKLNCRATFQAALDGYVAPVYPNREQRRNSVTYKAMCVTLPTPAQLATLGNIRSLEYTA